MLETSISAEGWSEAVCKRARASVQGGRWEGHSSRLPSPPGRRLRGEHAEMGTELSPPAGHPEVPPHLQGFSKCVCICGFEKSWILVLHRKINGVEHAVSIG